MAFIDKIKKAFKQENVQQAPPTKAESFKQYVANKQASEPKIFNNATNWMMNSALNQRDTNRTTRQTATQNIRNAERTVQPVASTKSDLTGNTTVRQNTQVTDEDLKKMFKQYNPNATDVELDTYVRNAKANGGNTQLMAQATVNSNANNTTKNTVLEATKQNALAETPQLAQEKPYETGEKFVRNKRTGDFELKGTVLKEPQVITDLKKAFSQENAKGWNLFNASNMLYKTVTGGAEAVGETAKDTGVSVLKGIAGMGEGIDDFKNYAYAQMVDWASNLTKNEKGKDDLKSYATDIREEASKSGEWLTNIQEWQDDANRNSALGKKGEQAGEAIGSSIPTMALDVASGGLGKVGQVLGKSGLVGMAISSAGNSLTESYQKRGKLDALAWAKAGVDGVTTYGTEEASGLLGKGITWDNKLATNLNKYIDNSVAKTLVRLNISSMAEGTEEIEEYFANKVTNSLMNTILNFTGDNGARYEGVDSIDMAEAVDNYVMGYISSFLTQGATKIGQIGINSRGSNIKQTLDQMSAQEEANAQKEIEETNLKNTEKRLEKAIKKEKSPDLINYLTEQLNAVKGQIESLNAPTQISEQFKQVLQGRNVQDVINENTSEPEVAENTQMMYNNTEGDVENEFRRIQEEGSRLSNEERRVLYGTDRTRINEIRQNIESLLQTKLENYWSSNNDSKRTITNKQTGETTTFAEVTPQDFYDAFATNRAYMKNPDSVDLHSVDDYKDGKAYLTNNGMSGLFIRSDGDIQSVFNNSGKPGFLESIAEIVKSEGKKLDCFQNKQQALADLYEGAFGYKVASTMDFSREVMEEEHGKEYTDAFVEKYGEAPVYFMVNTNQDVEAKHFNKDQYDEAVQYRDSFLNENAQNEGSFNLPEEQEVPQAQVLEQEPMNEANMDNLLQEVDKQVAPVRQKQELPKKKKGKYQSVIESSTNTRIVDKRNRVPLKKALEAVKKLGEDIYQATVNQRYFTDKLAKKVGNDKLIYKGDKALSSGATANFVIDRKQTNYNNTKVVGDSVNGMMERAKKDGVYEPLNDYLYLKNHADRKAQGKGFLGLSVEEANQKANDLMQRYPKIKGYVKEIHDFCHNELQVLVDSGVISEKWATAWEKMYPNYVPVFSQLSGKIEDNVESDTVTGGRGVKKAKGGTYDIAPIDIALANYTTKIRRAVATNNFIKELANSIKMEENGTNEGLETYEIIEPESLFEETNAPVQEVDGKYQGIYFENGVAHPFELTKDLYKSAKEISTDTIMDRIGKTIGLQKFTELQRNLQTTYNLPFGVVNYLKDAQAGLYNSKNPLNYEKNVPLAWKELVTNNNKTKNYKSGDTLSTLDSFLANGGLMASYFNSEEGTISNSKGIRGKIANANASIEMSHRLAEYMSTMELREKSLRKQLEADGLSKKEIDSIIEEQRADFIDEAVYNASEITTNFKRGGAFVKMLNRNGFNYLNASVQGFDRFVRTATQNRTVGEWAGFISKVALLGIAPAIVNNLILGDDDDYKKLRDNDKDLYYLIKIGDGKFIRIPKGRELSVFGTWARRTGEAIGGKGLEAYKGMGETVSNQVAPNNPVTNNVFAPLIQAVNNETWWGGEIVKGQMKDRPASEQYDEYTDDFSKFLGSKLNMSPKKINYAINQYTGGIGDVILPSITPATKGVNPVTNVFKDKFTVDSVLKNRLSTDFNNLVKKQESLANMTNASDEDKLKNKYLQMMKKELYQFYDEKSKILNDESLSYKDKQEKVRDVQREINQWMEETMQKYDKVEKVDEDISRIGDEFYVKNKGGKYAGEYRELYDNEVEEMNNLYKAGVSEKDYIRFKQDNTYYDDEGKAHQKKSIDKINYMLNDMDLSEKQLKAMYTETVGSEDKTFKEYKGSAMSYLRFKSDSDKQKNKRTSEEGASVTQADKMNALIKGKYDNKERQLLYDTFVNDDDTVYKALKKSDINMKEYLKFKQADLKADKKDDGTINGKTVSGSKKAKVVNYINSMNITYEQKLLLMGDQYKLSNQERTKLANYINGLNMSKKDKMDLYSKMSGFTVYKDGRVTW